jgi:hypothetical protein
MLIKRILLLLFLASLLSACAGIEILQIYNLPKPAIASLTPTLLKIVSQVPPTSTTQPSQTPTPTLSPTPLPTRTPRPSFTPTISPPPIVRVGPNNIPSYVNPLTGLIVSNPALLERRPLAVKIALFPLTALPPTGASLADHIYEYYLESGLSRWIGIFYGNDTYKVGPVRSARIFDAEIVQMYQSAFIFNGAHANEDVEKLDVLGYLEEHLDKNYFIVEATECKPYLCRDKNIPGYNNLFGNTYAMSQLITERGIDNSRINLESNYFYSLGIRSRVEAARIFTYYSFQSYNRWDYDPLSGRYLRFQGNSYERETYMQLIDRVNDLPIAADNLVFLLAPHTFYYKSDETEIFDIDLSGSGDAYVFRDGMAYEVQWYRAAKDKPISIQTIAGTAFPLKPGTTFFEIVNTTSEITQNDGDWFVEFRRPEDDSYEAEPTQN